MVAPAPSAGSRRGGGWRRGGLGLGLSLLPLLLLLWLSAAASPAHALCDANAATGYQRQLDLLRSRVHMTLFSADQGKTTDSASASGSDGGSRVVSAQSAAAQRDYDTLHARFQLLCGGGGGGGQTTRLHASAQTGRYEGQGRWDSRYEQRAVATIADFSCVCPSFSSLSGCAPRHLVANSDCRQPPAVASPVADCGAQHVHSERLRLLVQHADSVVHLQHGALPRRLLWQ